MWLGTQQKFINSMREGALTLERVLFLCKNYNTMTLLELQETLTLPELLRIAYEAGNSNASRPEGNYQIVEEGFDDWLDDSKELIKKLIIEAKQ